VSEDGSELCSNGSRIRKNLVRFDFPRRGLDPTRSDQSQYPYRVSCIDDTGKLAILGLQVLTAEPGYCLKRCREIQMPKCVVITMCMHAPAVFFLRRACCCYVPAKIEGWILSTTSRFGRQRAYSFVHARPDLGFLRVRSGCRDLSLAICNGKQRMLGNLKQEILGYYAVDAILEVPLFAKTFQL